MVPQAARRKPPPPRTNQAKKRKQRMPSPEQQKCRAEQNTRQARQTQYRALSQSPITPFAVRSAISPKCQLPEYHYRQGIFPPAHPVCPFVPSPSLSLMLLRQEKKARQKRSDKKQNVEKKKENLCKVADWAHDYEAVVGVSTLERSHRGYRCVGFTLSVPSYYPPPPLPLPLLSFRIGWPALSDRPSSWGIIFSGLPLPVQT